jgi:hypothetical protein
MGQCPVDLRNFAVYVPLDIIIAVTHDYTKQHLVALDLSLRYLRVIGGGSRALAKGRGPAPSSTSFPGHTSNFFVPLTRRANSQVGTKQDHGSAQGAYHNVYPPSIT